LTSVIEGVLNLKLVIWLRKSVLDDWNGLNGLNRLNWSLLTWPRSKSATGLNPSVWTVFGGEFRMPSGEKKGVADERAEEVFAGVQA